MGAVDVPGGALRLPRSGATLQLVPRGSQESYGRMLSRFDVGLALMCTPHPGLVAIEMAAAGMATVTNTFDNKDVAAILNLSLYTVETHRSNILQKLNLHSGAELILYAIRKGVIS